MSNIEYQKLYTVKILARLIYEKNKVFKKNIEIKHLTYLAGIG